MSNQLLKPKGLKWNDLSIDERIQIQNQMPEIVKDGSLYLYKFYYSTNFKTWIITNAMSVPMSLKKAVWVK